MSLSDALSGAVTTHKSIAKKLINASAIQLTVIADDYVDTPNSGSPMFADMDDAESTEPFGPFNALWTDADAAAASPSSREYSLIRRFSDAEVVAKVWLEDVLVDSDDVYGQTYFDKSIRVTSDGHDYEVLGYDRYGLATTKPYILAIVLRGSPNE